MLFVGWATKRDLKITLVVMDLEVLLGLGSHGNPQDQQRVKSV